MKNKFAVLGGGNAGFAFAGHLGLKGYSVNLYEDPSFEKNLEVIKANGGIYLKDLLTGFGPVNTITTSMKDAVDDVDIIIISVPEFAQRNFFSEYLKYAKDGQVIVFFPGNYASFKFKKLVEASNKKLILAEASSIPYGARKREEGTVNIIGWKSKLHLAALPANKTDYVLEKLNEFNDVFIPGNNVLEVSLNNPNFVVHCTAMALNAGWVESTEGNFSLYWQGISPSVSKVLEAVDAERLSVANAFGFKILSEKEFFEIYYGLSGNSLYEVIQKSENHGHSGAPKTLKDRYIEEDAPAGLTAVVALSKKVGVPTPVCQAILTVCSTLNGKDYYELGLNLKNLGIEHMSKEEIIKYVV